MMVLELYDEISLNLQEINGDLRSEFHVALLSVTDANQYFSLPPHLVALAQPSL